MQDQNNKKEEVKTYVVYSYLQPNNNKRYVGIAKRAYNRRFEHKSHSVKLDNKWGRALRKYGYSSFIYMEHRTNLSAAQAIGLEKYYIALFDSKKYGYNSTLGGDGAHGRKVSDITKRKMSLAKRKPKKQYAGKIISDLTEEELKEAVQLYKSGYTYTKISKHFGIIHNTGAWKDIFAGRNLSVYTGIKEDIRRPRGKKKLLIEELQ